jgi:hypothetical protein
MRYKYQFWAFRSRPQALKGERIIFTFDGEPVAESVVAFVEAPGSSRCDNTGKYLNFWKVYWNPKDFKKYKTK